MIKSSVTAVKYEGIPIASSSPPNKATKSTPYIKKFCIDISPNALDKSSIYLSGRKAFPVMISPKVDMTRMKKMYLTLYYFIFCFRLRSGISLRPSNFAYRLWSKRWAIKNFSTQILLQYGCGK
jgi:hypothetical protein